MSHDKKSKKTFQVESSESSINSSDELVKETPVDYLYHTNTTDLIKEALNEIIVYRPDDPIQFLIDHFSPINESVVTEAYKRLCRCHYTESTYQRNVLEVYNKLMAMVNETFNLKGLLGGTFNEVLDLIYEKVAKQYIEKCILKFKVRSHHVVSFNHFYNCILISFVVLDCVKICEAVYNDLDLNNTGKASETLCMLLLESFNVNKTVLTSNSTNTCVEVNPFEGYISKLQKHVELLDVTTDKYMEKDDFIKDAITKLLDL